LRLPIRSVKFLSTSLRLRSDFFYLPCFFDALVPRPEIVAVENFPSISVNMCGVASENPDLRIRSWRGCAETSRNQDGPKIIFHSQKPSKAESQRLSQLIGVWKREGIPDGGAGVMPAIAKPDRGEAKHVWVWQDRDQTATCFFV
jgi:hypothetical protein